MKNPLNVILGCSKLIIDDRPLEDPVRQIFVQIAEIANDLQNQIDLLIVDKPSDKSFDGAATLTISKTSFRPLINSNSNLVKLTEFLVKKFLSLMMIKSTEAYFRAGLSSGA